MEQAVNCRDCEIEPIIYERYSKYQVACVKCKSRSSVFDTRAEALASWLTINNKWEGSLRLVYAGPPTNELELAQCQSAMASQGNYPPGMDACSVVGINGGCGKDCMVLHSSECPIDDEMKENLGEDYPER